MSGTWLKHVTSDNDLEWFLKMVINQVTHFWIIPYVCSYLTPDSNQTWHQNTCRRGGEFQGQPHPGLNPSTQSLIQCDCDLILCSNQSRGAETFYEVHHIPNFLGEEVGAKFSPLNVGLCSHHLTEASKFGNISDHGELRLLLFHWYAPSRKFQWDNPEHTFIYHTNTNIYKAHNVNNNSWI